MISDFTPVIHQLDGRTIRVWAIADVHIGAKECMLNEFSAFLKRIEADPDSYIVICGDLLNNGIKDSLTNVYEETLPPHAQIEKAVELLSPIKDRILGVVGGNHELRSKKSVDLDPLYSACLMLGIGEVYRQNMCFIRVNLKRGNTKEHYSILLIHGKTANKKKHFQYAVEGVDCIISGHTHDGIIEKPARLVFSTYNNVVVKSLISITATSWLDYGGYAARGLYLPKQTGNPQCVEFEFSGTNNRRGQIKVIW